MCGKSFPRVLVGACLAASVAAPAAPAGQPLSVKQSAPPAPWSLRQRPEEARFYLDASASMAGYGKALGSPFYDLLFELKSVLFRQGVGVHELRAAAFGGRVDPLRSVNGFVELLAMPAARGNSCLALPFRQEAKFDSTVRPGFMVVATDGIASASGDSCGASCSAGSDAACVASQAVDYVRRGNGLWVFGIRAAFDGTYYFESGDVQSGSRAKVLHAAQRPVYLWIGGPDVEAGRRLVQSLTRWAEARHLSTLSFEVWPGDWDGPKPSAGESRSWTPAALAAGHDLRARCQGDARVSCVGGTDSEPVVVLSAEGRTRSRWGVSIPLAPIVKASGLRSLLRWTVAANAPLGGESGTRVLWGGLRKVGRSDVADICAAVNPDGGGAITLQWHAALDTEWLSGWSTDDDRSGGAAEARTLNLEGLWSLVGDRLQHAQGDALSVPILSFGQRPADCERDDARRPTN